jgi:LPXTG-site transpeptidase (sortase) family protein
MEAVPPAPSIDVDDARRERAPYVRSLLRFAGITALCAAIERTPLRTRTRKMIAAAVASAALVGLGLALIVPSVRTTTQQPGQAIIHVAGGGSDTVGGGGDVDVSKQYPRIYSTKLGIDVAIKPGDGKTPPVQPIAFQYPNTAALGSQTGNTYLYAHDRPGMFLGLHQAKIGDVVIVAMTPTQKLYYQVTEIHANVAWNDLEWLQPSQDARLTLQTCNYSGDFDPRYIVVTKPIPADEGRALTNNA